MDGNEVREGGLPSDALKQDASRGGAHLRERLANRGETRVVKCSVLNVVEANDGNICWNLEAVVHEGANGTDGRNVVVANERGEIGSALEEFVGRLESKLGCRDAELEFDDEFGRDGQFEIAGNGHEAAPAIIGVGTVAAAAHESDFAVAELIEVTEGEFSSALLIKDDVCDAFNFAMAGDDDGRENSNVFFEGGINKDEAFNGAIHEESRVLLDEVGFTAVTRGEVEVAFFNEVLFEAAEDLHGVAVTEFGNEDTDGECLALAQGPREEAGAVVEFGGSLNDAVARFLGDGTDAGSVIQNKGNGGRREVEVLTQGAQTDGLARERRRSRFGSLGHAFLF